MGVLMGWGRLWRRQGVICLVEVGQGLVSLSQVASLLGGQQDPHKGLLIRLDLIFKHFLVELDALFCIIFPDSAGHDHVVVVQARQPHPFNLQHAVSQVNGLFRFLFFDAKLDEDVVQHIVVLYFAVVFVVVFSGEIDVVLFQSEYQVGHVDGVHLDSLELRLVIHVFCVLGGSKFVAPVEITAHIVFAEPKFNKELFAELVKQFLVSALGRELH